MLILLAAAALMAPDPTQISPQPGPVIVWRRGCDERLARTAVYTPADLKRLGDLPPGIRMLAVDKRVAGCPVTVLPQRDETGQHMMLMGRGGRLHQMPASEPQRRLQRDRQR